MRTVFVRITYIYQHIKDLTITYLQSQTLSLWTMSTFLSLFSTHLNPATDPLRPIHMAILFTHPDLRSTNSSIPFFFSMRFIASTGDLDLPSLTHSCFLMPVSHNGPNFELINFPYYGLRIISRCPYLTRRRTVYTVVGPYLSHLRLQDLRHLRPYRLVSSRKDPLYQSATLHIFL